MITREEIDRANISGQAIADQELEFFCGLITSPDSLHGIVDLMSEFDSRSIAAVRRMDDDRLELMRRFALLGAFQVIKEYRKRMDDKAGMKRREGSSDGNV